MIQDVYDFKKIGLDIDEFNSFVSEHGYDSLGVFSLGMPEGSFASMQIPSIVLTDKDGKQASYSIETGTRVLRDRFGEARAMYATDISTEQLIGPNGAVACAKELSRIEQGKGNTGTPIVTDDMEVSFDTARYGPEEEDVAMSYLHAELKSLDGPMDIVLDIRDSNGMMLMEVERLKDIEQNDIEAVHNGIHGLHDAFLTYINDIRLTRANPTLSAELAEVFQASQVPELELDEFDEPYEESYFEDREDDALYV